MRPEIILLLDESMPSVQTLRKLNLPQVDQIIDVRKNGWSKKEDDELLRLMVELSKKQKNKLYIFLTRDEEFIRDSKCEQQEIDIQNGNLRVVIVSWGYLGQFLKILKPTKRTLGETPTNELASVLVESWPGILGEFFSNWPAHIS